MDDILNQGQKAAAEGFFNFLFSDQKELIISGPGGVGKTFLMSYLIDRIIPEYQNACQLLGKPSVYDTVTMTATTNKAAEVLSVATNRPTQTIHSYLGLIVYDDYATGKSILKKTRSWTVHQNEIIFIDEASMIDTDLLKLIHEGTKDCKIVYVGDHCQLAPVMESLSPIYKKNFPFYELTEPMRNNGQPALQAICKQLRETVETGIFKPIKLVPGVIDLLDDQQMENEVKTHFSNPDNNYRIVAYTNKRVIDYNNYIREMRSYTLPYETGENLVNNNAFTIPNGKRIETISVEDRVKLLEVSAEDQIIIDRDAYGNDVTLDIVRAKILTHYGKIYIVSLPTNKTHYRKLINYYKNQKNWIKYFELKNNYMDLRPEDASTVHKSQGSTFDTVFIDLSDLSTCRQPDMAARLLYVAFTRARNRVVLYGKLKDKFGGIQQ